MTVTSALGTARDHRQQAALADAAAGEDAHALAAAERGERVDDADAQRERGVDASAVQRVRRRAVDADARQVGGSGRPSNGRPSPSSTRPSSSSPTGTVNGRPVADDEVAGADPGDRAERQAGREMPVRSVLDGDDLGGDDRVGRVDLDEFADARSRCRAP